jgi:hypothetical protein
MSPVGRTEKSTRDRVGALFSRRSGTHHNLRSGEGIGIERS